MAGCIEGPTYANNTSDVSICPWGDGIHHCVFLKDPVPISDIKACQIRVHSDYIQGAITKCEDETSHEIPFFCLKPIEFGHPRHAGVFSSCTNAAEVLKAHVEKLPLQDENQIIVEDRSVGTVDALYDTLSERSMEATNKVLGWAKDWRKDKLVEQRTEGDVTKHKILIAKCLGADKEFRDFYEVR